MLQDDGSAAQDGGILETPSGKNASTENFPVGSFLIRAELRPHVHAFYRFARAADDISDNALLEPGRKIAALDQYAAALEGGDDSAVPAVRDLRASLQATGVTAQHSLDLLAAFKRDATQLRYRDWDDLLDYCRYSASPVGRHVLALHGIGEAAWPSNDALCSALQIINHVQDCADDYRTLDRVYLPQDMLARRGASTAMLAAEKSPPELRATLDDMLDAMTPMLAVARDLPRRVPDIRLKCETAVIHALAVSLTALLRRRDPLHDKVKLGPLASLGAVSRGFAGAWL